MKNIKNIILVLVALVVGLAAGMFWKEYRYTDACLDLGGAKDSSGICVVEQEQNIWGEGYSPCGGDDDEEEYVDVAEEMEAGNGGEAFYEHLETEAPGEENNDVGDVQQADPEEMAGKELMLVKVPVLKWDGKEYIVDWKRVQVKKNPAVLNTVYTVLFMDPELKSEQDIIHPLAGNEGIMFKSVSLKDGVAKVYLTGDYRPAGSMSSYYLRKGIDAAAFQYPAVDVVEVYLNGQKWNWCDYSEADPEEDGCNLHPRYWTDTRAFYETL